MVLLNGSKLTNIRIKKNKANRPGYAASAFSMKSDLLISLLNQLPY